MNIANRTRRQCQPLAQHPLTPARNQSRKRKRETGFHEFIDVEDYCLNNRASETTSQQVIFVDDDDDEEEEEKETDEDLETSLEHNHGNQNNTTDCWFRSSEDEAPTSSESQNEFDHVFALLNERPNHLETEMKMKKIDQTPIVELSDSYSPDDHVARVDEESDFEECVYSHNKSDSDDGVDIFENQKEAYDNLQKTTKSLIQSTEDDTDDEDEPFSSSESEDSFDDCDFSLRKKKNNTKEKACTASSAQKDMSSSICNAKMKITDPKQPLDEAFDVNVHEEQAAISKVQAHHIKTGKQNAVKYEKAKRKDDDADCVDAILESIINNEDVHDKKGDACLPLKFRFEDSDDESQSRKTDDSTVEKLFEDMNFALDCEEISSYRIPKVETRENDACSDNTDLCKRGEHRDIYLQEQTGLRCRLCGAVVLESRYVISKLANYSPDKSRRRYRFDEQVFCNLEDPYSMDSNSNTYDICKQTKGTVWELIPINIQAHMYPHQREGFEFMWKNLLGTIDLSRLQTIGPRGDGGDERKGGGCIISHAPGTGKTFLTIAFMESFLKKFPKCCPVIVAPASMLLTWEAEFKKWRVGISFINLQDTEFLKKELISGSSKHNKDMIRAMKIGCWTNGGSVLGVSYNLYEKLTSNNSSRRNPHYEKVSKILLDMPGLVILDEGHTPRNKHSKIWNTLLKLTTKNRVILSGTPFQNNFRELFNTLHLVRPKTAKKIVNEKVFADMIQGRNTKKSRGRSTAEDIEKLKVIISPFVHVHKGHILDSKLPGLKQSVVLLNPSPFQKGFIDNLGNVASTFEYEYKVALVSVHPSLILHCSLSENEERSINTQQLEDVRLQPEIGVKTRFVMELIRLSLSLNEKVLIFSQYTQPSELLKDQITLTFGWADEKEIALIKGQINQTRRQKIINVFNDPRSELKVLLASTKCCSEGIHLYGGSRVVLLDVVWNPSVERQAISRAYRLGQKKVVYTYHLMTAGTTEEEKYDRQVEKGRVAEMVFSSASMAGEEAKNKVNVDDKILQEMVDNQQLKDIFKKIRYPENEAKI